MTDYRKQIYDRVKHGHQIGSSDRSAILLMIEEIEQVTAENKNLQAQIQYLDYQLKQYHKFDGLLAAHGCFDTNTNTEDPPRSVTLSTDGNLHIKFKGD